MKRFACEASSSSLFSLLAFGIAATTGVSYAGCPGEWLPQFGLPNGGTNGPVHALGTYNGELVAGGRFSTAGLASSSMIATWDGEAWQPMGVGLERNTPAHMGVSAEIHDLQEHAGELIVAGGFDRSGLQPLKRVARWNGLAWQSAAGGLYDDFSAQVDYAEPMSLEPFGGFLYVGGRFTLGTTSYVNFAAWTGEVWISPGRIIGPMPPINTSVRALTVFEGELVAGGSFHTAMGVPVSNVAAFNGVTCRPLGSGSTGATNGLVRTFAQHGGELIAGGEFTQIGGQAARYAAAWDGDAWRPLGDDTSNGLSDSAYAITIYNGELVAGGVFAAASGLPANRLARWNGNAWRPFYLDAGNGPDGGVRDLQVLDGVLYIGGGFSAVGVDQSAQNIAAWRSVCVTGDTNCDGVVSVGDIAGFVLALTNPAVYTTEYPDCTFGNNDVNESGDVSVSDIGPFVSLLTGG